MLNRFLILVFLIGSPLLNAQFNDNLIFNNAPTSFLIPAVFGDIDGDNDLDVINGSFTGNQLFWLENTNGLGDFNIHHNLIVHNLYHPTFVYLEDIDADNDLDIVYTSESAGYRIAWLENDGAGNFDTEHVITENALDIRLDFHDINNDGFIDILGNDDGKLAWFVNDGLGSFSTFENSIATGSWLPYQSAHAADIDNDGDLDVFAVTQGDKVVWFTNDNGIYSPEIEIEIDTPGNAHNIKTFDVDNDGDLDLLFATGNHINNLTDDNNVYWCENTDGLGNFANKRVAANHMNGPISYHFANIDGTTGNEIISASKFDDQIKKNTYNPGSNSFFFTNILAPNGPTSIYLDDVDNDGDVDILAVLKDALKTVWFENTDGLGNYSATQNRVTERMTSFTDLFAADIDNDGDEDIISASTVDNRITWFENDGIGNFGIARHLITTNIQGESTLFATDIDGDNDIDIVSASITDNKLAWYENNGLGDFGSQQVISINHDGLSKVFAVDIDGDNDMDLLAVSKNNASIYWYENTNGLGNFGAQQLISNTIIDGTDISATDIDGDNDLDIIATGINTSNIAFSWFENTNGLGNFGAQQTITNANFSGAKLLLSADMDNDGDMDIVVNDTQLAWFENTNGLGDFSTIHYVSQEIDNVYKVVVTDVDLDGDMDLVSTTIDLNRVVWFENTDGLGSFGAQQLVSDNFNAYNAIVATDINGDNVVDLVTNSVTNFNSKLIWHENTGNFGNEINGIIRYDANNDGCDANDSPVSNLLVRVDNTTLDNQYASFSTDNGVYQLFTNQGDVTSTIITNLPDYFTITPSTFSTTFNDTNSTEIVNYCISSTQNSNDVSIRFIPIGEARPGFPAYYQIIYENIGTTNSSGTIVLDFENYPLNFINIDGNVISQTGNSITFAYTNLTPFEKRIINTKFLVAAPPYVTIDDELTFTATINPTNADNTPNDNTYTLNQIVVGPYDPNDIHVLEGLHIDIDQANKYLHYQIRFQNLGNAEAVNVKITNLLDEKLDWNTIQIESSSAPLDVEIINNNKVVFQFNNIHLPSKNQNESNSTGFIAYRIKLKPEAAVGDLWQNSANIYFDFNPAIKTNTVATSIIGAANVNDYAVFDYIVYPNPAKDILHLSSRKSNITAVTIYDSLGRVVLLHKDIDIKNINIVSLSKGVYVVKIKDQYNQTASTKLIKE